MTISYISFNITVNYEFLQDSMRINYS